MPSIGPALPPHLAKRKRSLQDDGDGDGDDALAPCKLSRHDGAPPVANDDELPLDDDDDNLDPSPALGPSLPPSFAGADLSGSGPAARAPSSPPKRQPLPAASPGSDSDSDDYGPALPSASGARAPTIGPSLPPSEDSAPQRDSWMLAPPPAGGGYSERDPTRIRARKFASKASPATPAPGAPSIWTETPEEKLRRLQNAVLGRSDTEAGPAAHGKSTGAKSERQQERDRKIAASIEAQRGSSLYDEHSQKRRHGVAQGDEDDDPSQRPFDRDKDLALGGKIGTAKRRELVSKSANFGGRFQKGSYL